MVLKFKYFWTQDQAAPLCPEILFKVEIFHLLLKFASIRNTQVGNGQYINVLFIISVKIDIHGNRFEVYTIVSEMHKYIDLVLIIKDIFELESIINPRKLCCSFINRSIPFSKKKK